MSNLEILQKIYDYEKIQYDYLKKYPKGEKFALVTEIKNTTYSLSKKLLKASMIEKKKSVLYEADVELFHLKHLIRLSHELKFMSNKAYAVSSEKLAEIGKMLGAWIKTVKNN